MPLQQIMPNFSGSAQSMNAAMEGIGKAGDVAGGILARVRQDAKDKQEEARYQTEQQYKLGRDKVLDADNAARMGLLQSAEGRQAEKFEADKATVQGNILASRDLQGATQGLITPEQSATILAAYNKNPKADVVGMLNKAQTQYEASPLLQRQYVSGVNVDQGPQEVTVGKDAAGQPIVKLLQGDVATSQELKNKMLAGYDTKIAAAALAAERAKEFDAEMGLKNATLAEQKSHNRAIEKVAKAEKAGKFDPMEVTYKDKTTGKTMKTTIRSPGQYQEFLSQPGMITTDPSTGKQTANFSYGTAYDTDFSNTTGGGSPVVPLITGLGGWDDRRLSKLATTLQTAGLSPKDSVGIANLAVDDAWNGAGVDFNKVVDVAYAKLNLKDPTLTRDKTAKLLNTAF